MLKMVQNFLTTAREQMAKDTAVDWRYLPVAAGAGIFVGVALVYISNLLGVFIILAIGAGVGYTARSYVSYRRRLRFYAEREEP